MEWFYAKNGQQLGPVSSQEIESLIKDGTISADSLVWREGMAEWKPANEVLTIPAASEQPTSSPDPEPAASQPEPAASEPEPAASQPEPAPAQVAAPAQPHAAGSPIAPGTVDPYLWQSICCIVLCCWPFAIPALIFSLKVNPALERGDLAEAQSASAQAKKWCLISLIAAVVGWVLYLGFVLLIGGMGAFAQ